MLYTRTASSLNVLPHHSRHPLLVAHLCAVPGDPYRFTLLYPNSDCAFVRAAIVRRSPLCWPGQSDSGSLPIGHSPASPASGTTHLLLCLCQLCCRGYGVVYNQPDGRDSVCRCAMVKACCASLKHQTGSPDMCRVAPRLELHPEPGTTTGLCRIEGRSGHRMSGCADFAFECVRLVSNMLRTRQV